MYFSTFKYPKLAKITPEYMKRKQNTPESLKKLLAPKDEFEIDEISLSGSEISDAFADIHKDSFFSHPKGEKRILTKKEADLLTMAQFTDMFKKTVVNTRKELQLEENMTLESMKDIRKILDEKREPKNLPDAVQERIKELLRDRENMCSTSSQLSEDPTATRKESSVAFDAMSGIWRMLAVHSDKKKFRISSPTFNAFKRDQPHWLDRPAVPWKTLDFSIRKCEKWLNEQQND